MVAHLPRRPVGLRPLCLPCAIPAAAAMHSVMTEQYRAFCFFGASRSNIFHAPAARLQM